MKLRELADRLGIANYPEQLELSYDRLEELNIDISSPDALDALEKEYHLFGEYYGTLREFTLSLKNDPDRLLWGNVIATCIRLYPAAKSPLPKTDETPLGDFYPLLVLMPLIPDVAPLYRSRGFTEDEVKAVMESFARIIENTKKRTGRPGYTQGYFAWQKKYVKGILFRFGSFNYELRKFGAAFVLKHRTTGEIVPFPASGTFHRDGMVLGSAGFTDEEGSFEAKFEETDEVYIGHPAENSLISSVPKTFPKTQWECVLRPKDPVVSVHIPSGVDLTPETVESCYRDGIGFVREHFPEFQPKAYYCDSWLLDPNLEEILGEKSKITQFMKSYVKWPFSSMGREVFSFVFVGFQGEISDLPENTSLERGLKKRYLDGKYIHAYQGILFR